MEDILYVVNIRKALRGTNVVVVATLEKDGHNYTYKPHNLHHDKFPRARKQIRTRGLPPIAQRRLYSRKRPDIVEILAKYSLNRYDEWELLKRTKGVLMTDNLMYLTKNELDMLKLKPEILDFIGVEESVARSGVY